MVRKLLAAGAMVVVLATPALAKGGHGNSTTATPSISLNQAAPYSLGEMVTFSTSYPTNTKNVSVALTCSQSGSVVYVEVGWPQDTFSLGGSASQWVTNGGEAACTAVLQSSDRNGVETALASTSFDASGAA